MNPTANFPVRVILIATLLYAFEGLMFTQSIEAGTAVEFGVFDGSCAEGSGIDFLGLGDFFGGIACLISRVVDVLNVVVNGFLFFVGLITFNIPGTPGPVRYVLSFTVGGAVLWAVLSMVRGN